MLDFLGSCHIVTIFKNFYNTYLHIWKYSLKMSYFIKVRTVYKCFIEAAKIFCTHVTQLSNIHLYNELWISSWLCMYISTICTCLHIYKSVYDGNPQCTVSTSHHESCSAFPCQLPAVITLSIREYCLFQWTRVTCTAAWLPSPAYLTYRPAHSPSLSRGFKPPWCNAPNISMRLLRRHTYMYVCTCT